MADQLFLHLSTISRWTDPQGHYRGLLKAHDVLRLVAMAQNRELDYRGTPISADWLMAGAGIIKEVSDAERAHPETCG